MSESLQARLDKLEAYYSEQDYTLQTLNDVVAQQNREISQLSLNLEQLKQQIETLKTEPEGESNPEHEVPPHY